MAKGNEIEDRATGGRKRAKIQSNKHKHNNNNKSNSINGTDNDHRDEPQDLIVPDFETEDGYEVAQNDNSDEEEDGEEAKSSEIANRRGNKAENGDERGKSGVTKEEKKQKKSGKSKKSESDDSHSFPMHRISRIIKSEDADIRITQEAVFLVNKATEKFLELFCKEAGAGAFLDRKNQVWYEHLSSVVSKRKRFDFLSDFVPEKVKAEDALAEMPIAET
ncbi:DNA polymerase epsilon subunit C like [Actinidia chinensis var. chinensis]|uniref:DNA polymerase epsilon subunit C like n=1 Tax=Actinidia chinensis var. chinensis TaxID=1590841 RepID=A0A2R6QTG3_ACTCC|nr:DNA polymerase epsilon subunit C like [Actinidia chinensis var. chinensis]